ncbi:hypothetical protein RHGRI_014999 [Rhododendron griersonianum]|uniref:Uncharacterized protein n=1 Tax=Rhododendron griersonianum TaxID=479676 RepID=A0AAV6KBR0_9ERIC|nr:hypothetical protein RHGRI_014999 [Rhododendron griersonianum]
MAKQEDLDVGEANKREREEEESGDKEEGEEDSDFDSDTGEMDVDDHGDWLDLSEFGKMPEKPPTSMAFPASMLRYVQEKHNPRPSNDTVLVNILEDDEGLAREKTYSVWEMKSQNRKIKDGENIHLASYLDEGGVLSSNS